MEFTIKTGMPEKLKTGSVVVGIFADGQLGDAAAALDKASKGKFAAILGRGDLEDKAGSLLAIHDLPGSACERVLAVGLGKRDEFGDKAWRDALAAVGKALASGPASDVAVCLADIPVPGRDIDWAL